MRKIFTFAVISLMSLALHGQISHPILPLGSPAPNFSLPGVDGKIHKLSDYASSPILVVIFTCDHCPIAQMYENRIEKLYDDYRNRGVAVVAIEGNDPNATTIDELDSSDLGDTPEDMKIRVQYKHLHYPYLYDGANQSVTRAYGPQATPHVFVFDKERRLRYEGRFDNSYRIEKVTTHDAQNAIDALLANKPVQVTHTAVFGCSTKWREKEALRAAYEQKLDATASQRESGGRRSPEEAARQCRRQLHPGQLLGNLVRLMCSRVRRSAGHIPHVQRSRIQSGDRIREYAG